MLVSKGCQWMISCTLSTGRSQPGIRRTSHLRERDCNCDCGENIEDIQAMLFDSAVLAIAHLLVAFPIFGPGRPSDYHLLVLTESGICYLSAPKLKMLSYAHPSL